MGTKDPSFVKGGGESEYSVFYIRTAWKRVDAGLGDVSKHFGELCEWLYYTKHLFPLDLDIANGKYMLYFQNVPQKILSDTTSVMWTLSDMDDMQMLSDFYDM
ncbi:hypothetical protein CEXT_456351 [Caerostris extrusa]|uniref:Uncharacterized protein n=1 Tax=Caerostris extrusa TaxID=172846 RepID=A0AAV4UUZ7_CAEEX|nr:hypothetical protein CEXT_456351 [Caerostris extrusa]